MIFSLVFIKLASESAHQINALQMPPVGSQYHFGIPVFNPQVVLNPRLYYFFKTMTVGFLNHKQTAIMGFSWLVFQTGTGTNNPCSFHVFHLPSRASVKYMI